ncbi:exodeoxyribonuclease VII large subunit [Selenomonas sp. TAMA-11512]|uniref:exodeoxyribonuclease VII large subunit n=1 Tax=Selenomonas sp. TAMA-11512 TaxID=3095337 RepID=UPI00308C76B8|nr:exodeoxyribonuclease VII large subunit [Selenomonas sp. TAMA-11512]
MTVRAHSVSELTRYIKQIFQAEDILHNIAVEGELSNFKRYPSGHCYFTLKDKDASLKCVMFKSYAGGLRFLPENGMMVILTGSISVYERDGVYQLYAEQMLPAGIGEMHLAYEQLKERLEKEGLFAAEHKASLPFYPHVIGVVTSRAGAVLRDIYRVSKRRNPYIRLVLYPVQVQGESAAAEISRGIRFFNEKYPVDVLIVGRGGGSREDLWAFNEEPVVRAIYASKIPVISAVGHETDTTLADFVSDVRASTPSQAAELAVPERAQLVYTVHNMERNLQNALLHHLQIKKRQLHQACSFYRKKTPERLLAEHWQRADHLLFQLDSHKRMGLERKEQKFLAASAQLELLNPLRVLARGYGIVEQAGEPLHSVKALCEGNIVQVTVQDGSFSAMVQKVKRIK